MFDEPLRRNLEKLELSRKLWILTVLTVLTIAIATLVLVILGIVL